jgi:hypothetical protein
MALARRKKRSVKTSEESWAEIFEDWKRSGLSAEEFCERNNYSVYVCSTFLHPPCPSLLAWRTLILRFTPL